MRNTIIIGGAVLLIGAIAAADYFSNSTVSYESTRIEQSDDAEVIATSTPEYPEEWLEEAEAAKEAVLEKKRLEKKESRLVDEITSKQAELDAVRKELGVYWRNVENVKRLIRETFPEDPHTAVAIAKCESGLNPKAYNGSNSDGSTDGGLFQINSTHDARLQQLGLNKYDPEDAAQFARILYNESGWRPWVCAWSKRHLALDV